MAGGPLHQCLLVFLFFFAFFLTSTLLLELWLSFDSDLDSAGLDSLRFEDSLGLDSLGLEAEDWEDSAGLDSLDLEADWKTQLVWIQLA